VATKKKSINFEKNLEELEALVESLESGGLTLEDSLKTFERGIRITRECQEALNEAEQKVNLLTRGDGGSVEISEFPQLDND